MKTNVCLEQLLADSPWMSCLAEHQTRQVRQAIYIENFQPGDIVCPRSSVSAHWLGVIEGMLKLENISESGKVSTFATVPAGAWFGEGQC